MHRPLIAAALALAVPLSLSACSSAPAAVADDRECLEVSGELLARIAEGASGVAMTPIAGAAVESSGAGGYHVVAMAFSAPGGDDLRGTWAATAIDGSSTSILAVDGFAQEFTQWPGQVGGVELDVTTDGVSAALACLDR